MRPFFSRSSGWDEPATVFAAEFFPVRKEPLELEKEESVPDRMDGMSSLRESDTPQSLLEQLCNQPQGESWERMVAIYAPLLRGWLARYQVQEADAEDLIQDVLMVVLRELPGFRHNQQPGAFRSWLRRILVNRVRNLWRRRDRGDLACGGTELARALNELEDPHSQISRVWDREHDRYLTRKLLEMVEERFTQTTRKVFHRLVFDGVRADQVAAEFGLSLNAVFTAKSRVLRELRRLGQGLLD
jgi:RNA polymerase sigma-70 factor (ECF subfamily)